MSLKPIAKHLTESPTSLGRMASIMSKSSGFTYSKVPELLYSCVVPKIRIYIVPQPRVQHGCAKAPGAG